MNKLFFILVFVFSFNFCFSQTSTEKWNDYKKQYEYFDSNGNMTAYKVYNSYKKQWETYTVQTNNYRPLTLPDTQLIRETLSTLQGRYDANFEKVADKVKLIYKAIDYLVLDVIKDGEALNELDYKYASHIKYLFQEQYVKVIQNQSYDYSKTSTTYNVIKYLENGSINLVKKELGWVESVSKENYYLYVRKFSEKVQ